MKRTTLVGYAVDVIHTGDPDPESEYLLVMVAKDKSEVLELPMSAELAKHVSRGLSGIEIAQPLGLVSPHTSTSRKKVH